MAWVNNALVVAGVTADSDQLHQAMLFEASRGPARFTLVMPRSPDGPRGAIDAALRLRCALTRAAGAGLQVSGGFGDSDPVIAAVENFDPWRVDKIIVCTLPTGLSRWCGADAPARIRRLTGAPVLHVEATRPSHPATRTAAAA